VNTRNHQPRRWVSALAVVPVMTVAWMGLGAGTALAAPGGNSSAPASANAAGPNDNSNGGVGQDKGNGNAKHDDSTPATTGTDPSTTTTATDAGTADSHGTGGTAGTSGDVTKPQPVSKADQNSGGANGKCTGAAYCSTRDGSPSGNGNGKGKAVGKPCAGCVGKADNKNPKGQNPNGSDHNKGYECDGNHGIGRTNPAHTGCTPPTPPSCDAPSTLIDGVCTPPCPSGQTRVNGVCTTSNDGCPEGEHLSNGTCVPDDNCVPSAANNNCTNTCPDGATAGTDGTCVLGEKKTRKPTGSTTVLGEKVSRLPFTGLEAGWMVEGGAAALALGALLLAAGGRRRRQTSFT
jgi:hypothetical protein